MLASVSPKGASQNTLRQVMHWPRPPKTQARLWVAPYVVDARVAGYLLAFVDGVEHMRSLVMVVFQVLSRASNHFCGVCCVQI